jgi:hypothetical protein
LSAAGLKSTITGPFSGTTRSNVATLVAAPVAGSIVTTAPSAATP